MDECSSNHFRYILKCQPGPAWASALRVTQAEVDQEVASVAAVGEKLFIKHGVVEAAHGTDIQPQHACGHYQVSPLQGGVTPGGFLGLLRVLDEALASVGRAGKQVGHVLMEARIHRYDHSDGGRMGFVAVAFGKRR